MAKNKLILPFLLSFILLVSGCGPGTLTEKYIENKIEKETGQNAKVDMNNGQFNMQTADGTSIQTGEGVELPSDFPKDVYIPKGELVSVMKNVVGAGYSVSLYADDSAEAINKQYLEKLKESGWSITMQVNTAGTMMIGAKKDTRNLSFSVSAGDEGKIFVVITVTDTKSL